MTSRSKVVLLAGGVGGAKLAVGLAGVLPAGNLTVIVNTGDDFEHLGLYITPDLDTVLYSLAGIANPETGWGLAGDTFTAIEMVARLGGPSWFRLGDTDLGMSLARTSMLNSGQTLSAVVKDLGTTLGVLHSILPMTNDPVRTILSTTQGSLAFQEYFVKERWQPVVSRLEFVGIQQAQPSPGVLEAIEAAELIIFGPSNPFLSIDPILNVPGIRHRITLSSAPVFAVSPIVGGKAIKGPAAKLMNELGIDASPLGIAQYYEELLDGIILDSIDQHLISDIQSVGVKSVAENTMMNSAADKAALAASILKWAEAF